MLSNQIALTHQNVLSYCGLVDAKMKDSDKDLPVSEDVVIFIESPNVLFNNGVKKTKVSNI